MAMELELVVVGLVEVGRGAGFWPSTGSNMQFPKSHCRAIRPAAAAGRNTAPARRPTTGLVVGRRRLVVGLQSRFLSF
jgi:hypothetical protein